jgi:predicted transcriptional regulator
MQHNQLNTTNPQNLTINYETLLFTIMGGIKLDGLHQLRATLRIEHKLRAFRHSLDLYNNGQLDGFIRKAAQKLELGPSYIDTAINHVINNLENYRLQEIEAQNKPIEKKQLTETEIKEAFELLTTKNLIKTTNELIGLSGVVGEELNRLIMYLVFTSRKMNRPLHIISFGSSGAGKSHLQEKVAELMPKEDVFGNTSLTGTALYYYEKHELKHKLLLFEDLDGLKEDSLYAWRELMSKRFISRSMPYKDSNGNTKTKQLIVEGPLSTAGCTTHESVYEDNANRCFLIYVDESKEQDKKIMEYQCNVSAGLIDVYKEQETKHLLQNAQRLLRNITVKNPFAPHLHLPDAVFKPRRTNAHYLQFIEAITFYKQYQRRWINAETSEIVYDPSTATSPPNADLDLTHLFIETTIEDIEEANDLLKNILIRKSDELQGAIRNYFETLKNHLHKETKNTFTNKDVQVSQRLSNTLIRRYNQLLIEQGYIKRNEKLEQEEKKKGYKTHIYEVTNFEDYEQLQSQIMNTLNTCLYNIKQQSPTNKEQIPTSKKRKANAPNTQPTHTI